jgi:hypothetical protein
LAFQDLVTPLAVITRSTHRRIWKNESASGTARLQCAGFDPIASKTNLCAISLWQLPQDKGPSSRGQRKPDIHSKLLYIFRGTNKPFFFNPLNHTFL